MITTTALLASVVAVAAQQVNSDVPEVHPQLTTWRCTTAGGCTSHKTSVVIDSNFRFLHTIGSTQVCTASDGTLNATLCPDAATCASNCALDGANYTALGVHTATSGADSALTLNMYVNGNGANPRVYLLDEDDSYADLRLVDQELAFDVDMSALPCGSNAALYLSEMNLTGGKSDLNRAGAAYGTGYCDAQCPVTKFINGEANTNRSGACCSEMDIWEANSRATVFTPHSCSKPGVYQCAGTDCADGGSGGVCDKSGCGYNPYKQGHPNFYGLNGTVNTTKPFTVVTQFLTNATTRDLAEIRRLYIQDGKIISSVSATPDAAPDMVITDAFCGTNVFEKLGGLKAMGAALQRGMVLIFSIWNDSSQFMHWLDSGSAGPCNATEGDPALIKKNAPGTSVTWSNIKWGDIGSTYSH